MKITAYLFLILLCCACGTESPKPQSTNPAPISNSPSTSTQEDKIITNFREKILLEVLDPEIAIKFKEVQQKNDSFLLELEQLRIDMIDTTGGYAVPNDIKTIRGRRNKDLPTRWLAYGEQGKQLEAAILNNRQSLLSLVDAKDLEDMKQNISLSIKYEEIAAKEVGKTWREYMFKNMPLAAVLPLLTKMGVDAQSSEVALFNYLSKKYPRKE
ncbi:MAG: hypothetical protein MK212_10500 [Saprospiraceae bacterium]|nr:hypothetical protein [Saprospiraceae bacterium]